MTRQNGTHGGSRAGFTLAEVTMAIFVVSVGIVGLISLFSVGLDSGVRATETTRAAQLAAAFYADLSTYFHAIENPDPASYAFEYYDEKDQVIVDIWPDTFELVHVEETYAPFGVRYELDVSESPFEARLFVYARGVETTNPPPYKFFYYVTNYRPYN